MRKKNILTTMRWRLDEELLPMLRGVRRVAIVDFPVHSNVGDSMIWLGQYQFLKENKIDICYVTSPNDYSEKTLRNCTTEDDVILILGGGNLGDIWLKEQKLRETVISRFKDRKIIQLPQSIWFNDEANLQRAKRVFLGHPDFTLMVRDEKSLALATEKLELNPLLAPDMAFYIQGLKRPVPVHNGVVWLGRKDAERGSSEEIDLSSLSIEYIDWVSAPGMPGWTWAGRLNRYSRFGLQAVTMGIKERIYLDIALKRISRGVEIVSRGKSLVTERLHGHILALLLDLPHVVLDNSYGKTGAFHQTWTKESDITHFASTKSEAARIAYNLAKG